MTNGRFVDIYAEPDGNGGYTFSMEEGGRATDTLTFDKNNDNMKKSEDYKVEFKLTNRKGANLIFSQKADKVMWAMATTGATGACPPEGSSFAPFYVDPASYPQKDRLVVINTDPAEQYFSFCLNFIPDGTKEDKNTKYFCYDPIGDNRNGGSITTFAETSTVTIVGLAVAAVAIVAVAAYELGFFNP